jgi:hypothetical protein
VAVRFSDRPRARSNPATNEAARTAMTAYRIRGDSSYRLRVVERT